MANFRIAIGYRTGHRRSTPVILGASTDPAIVQKAIDDAPADILRTEIGTFYFQRRGRKSSLRPQVSAPAPVAPAPIPAAENAGDAAVAAEDDGPTLDADPNPAPRRRR